MKKFTDQELNNALKAAPMAIQREIATGYDTATKISALKPKYNLHIDVLGIIAELNRNMLLGLIGPDEFYKDLIEAKIPDKDAREIMTEINQKFWKNCGTNPIWQEKLWAQILLTAPSRS